MKQKRLPGDLEVLLELGQGTGSPSLLDQRESDVRDNQTNNNNAIDPWPKSTSIRSTDTWTSSGCNGALEFENDLFVDPLVIGDGEGASVPLIIVTLGTGEGGEADEVGRNGAMTKK